MPNDLQLRDLEGEPVSAVCFVQDYVELHFDGPILRCLVGPVLKTHAFEGVFPDNGSRDALCSLIGESIRRLALVDEEELEIEFSSNSKLIVPLNPARRYGAEAMHFVPRVDGPIQVW